MYFLCSQEANHIIQFRYVAARKSQLQSSIFLLEADQVVNVPIYTMLTFIEVDYVPICTILKLIEVVYV